MRFKTVLCLLVCSLPIWAQSASAPNPDVSLLLRYSQRPSAVTTRALNQELGRLLGQAHVRLALLSSDVAAVQSGRLVVFDMRGYCGMDGPTDGIRSAEPLAFTFTSDGRPLPFGEVDCNAIRNSLARLVGTGDPQQHQVLFGQAVARVMAHEIYHVLAQSSEHTNSGITQASLTPNDLSNPSLTLPAEAETAIEAAMDPGR